MFCKYIRLFRSLTVLERTVILLMTVVVPVSFDLLQGLIATGPCLSCLNYWRLALYILWYPIAALVIAASTQADRTRVEVRHIQSYRELDGRIHEVVEELDRENKRTQSHTGNLNAWVSDLHQALEDELKTNLPGPRYSLGEANHCFPALSSEVIVQRRTADPPGKMVRLCLSTKRQAIRFGIWFYRTVIVDQASR